tara:strand:+ start:1237 stop:1461 length:225 start_codon:yes stop_codon:yes gene_type:complete
MDILVDNKVKVDLLQFQKMGFIYNAIENGWTVKKRDNKYVFTKNKKGEKEVFLDTYLRQFIENNFDVDNMLNTF